MVSRRIFLSYRRDDSPGYVSRLEAELEGVFGPGSVFRDVEDIKGGTKWQQVLDENLERAAAVLLVLGPRWERIWNERKDDAVNYVVYELERARELDVPVIPLTLDGVCLSRELNLGKIAWIRDHQTYDISDKQGRWSSDFGGLVRLLEGLDGLGRAPAPVLPPPVPAPKKSSKLKWLAVGAALSLALILLLGSLGNEPSERTPSPLPGPAEARREPARPPAQPSAASFPNIAGVWQGRDETIYHVEQGPGGRFTITSPGYANGKGRFLPNMPRKLEINMEGIGRGEFSVSAGGQRMIGWILVDGRQEYDTLTRVR